jgi:hypothetical protein
MALMPITPQSDGLLFGNSYVTSVHEDKVLQLQVENTCEATSRKEGRDFRNVYNKP